MEEFPVLLDDSSLHEVRIGRIEKENGVDIDLDDIGKECGFIESNNTLRRLFDEALRAFLSERAGGKSFRPVPVSCFDGRNVDLFKLFWVVRKIGGYDLVCSKHLWGFVVKQCGLASEVSAFLKLIYVRYLKEFDQWLWDLNKESNLDSERGTCRKLDLLVQELELKFRELLTKGVENKIEGGLLQLTCDENSEAAGFNGGGSVPHLLPVGDILESREGNSDDDSDGAKLPSESKKDLVNSRKRGFEKVINEICVDVKQCLDENGGKASALEDSDFSASDKRVRRDIQEVQKNSESDTDVHEGFCVLGNDNTMLSEKNDLEQGSDSQKLKRESLSFTKLLVWTRHAAKHSDDPRIGKIPKCSKWENHASLFALLVRKTRFLNRITRSSNDTSQLQKKLWTDDPTDNVQTRMSRRLCKECLAANVQHTESGDKEKEISPKSNMETTPERIKEISPKQNKGGASNKNQVPDKDGIEYKLSHKSRTHDIMVGSEYQAEIPEWTGKCESDSKWLGTRIWPPEEEQRNSQLSLLPVGRVRKSSCDCELKNSVECVRFHIAEKRFMLKRELGSLFFEWRFDQMGEEVSLSWTPEEEDKFKEVVTSNATYLWKKLARMFPSKTREMLVSYYFNVYMYQVRSYQNRITPTDIDSDSEEQCETIGERFGYKALKASNSCPQLCIENKQSFEFQ